MVERQTRSPQKRVPQGVRVRIPLGALWDIIIPYEWMVMIVKHKLDSVYVVADLEAHDNIKDDLIYMINNSKARSMSNEQDQVNITKVDWPESTDMSRPWVQLLMNYLNPHMSEVLKEMGFNKFRIPEIWFQQYFRQASHGWHTHGSNFTNVYYLELDSSAPKTVLVNPFTREEFTPDVQEGQTLIFPSYVVHKSPEDFFDKRKTIISWNLDADIEHPYYLGGQ